jgi:hypothetical protein
MYLQHGLATDAQAALECAVDTARQMKQAVVPFPSSLSR